MTATDGALGQRGYAICTQPRSGSNLLCQYLASTDRLGYPLEYFNGPGRRALGIPDFPDEPRRQIDYILRHGATPNGVYAVKLFAFQHDLIAPTVRWSEVLPQLRFVYLERRDLLGQAISWARAIQTNQYRSTQPVQVPPAYDGRLILENLLTLVRERGRWDSYFARTGIEPVRIVCENLVANPQSEINRVAQVMDVAEPVIIDYSRVTLSVQRDSLSENWRQRFRKEYGNPDVIDVS
jgi:LPS sulfotransferase NodH